MAEKPFGTRELVEALSGDAAGENATSPSSTSTPPPPPKPLTIEDLPKEILVSILMATEDPFWVRHTFPLVCKAWNELYLSKDASPLHETLDVDFESEVGSEWRRRSLRPIARAASQRQAPRSPVVHGSRVISWAERRVDSVRKLHLMSHFMRWKAPESVKGFSVEDLCALVEVVAPSLTEFRMTSVSDYSFCHLLEKTFWESLQGSIVPAGRMRSFVVEGYTHADITESVVAPLGRLAGSLEEVVLVTGLNNSSVGQLRFPVSFCDLTELRRLVLQGHKHMTAIPAEISSLKKLEVLNLSWCGLSSLPKEMGELSGLTMLNCHLNKNLGGAPHDGAFPAELGKLKSLRELHLSSCDLRAVPAFVGELKSLEVLSLTHNKELQIDAPLDFLVEGCPRLREVTMHGRWWGPEALAHIKAFEAKLLAKNPNAKVIY